MAFLESLSFFLSSALVLFFIYEKLPTTTFQKGIAILLIIFILFSKYLFSSSLKLPGKIFRLLMLFLASMFVQFLVVSSGGLYSPFLILLHLFTLGASFLLNIGSAISFLVFSLIVLVASTYLNETLLVTFQQDPGSAILYLISFIVIIPLAQYLMRTYHFKDTISKFLTEHIEIAQKREESILEGLQELVLVTDINLRIISANEAVGKILNLDSSVVNQNLLDVVKLNDKSGNLVTVESLDLDKVVGSKLTHTIRGFYLQGGLAKPVEVVISVKPITGKEGLVNQIVFVLTQAKLFQQERHKDLELARLRHDAIVQRLKEINSSLEIKGQIQLLGQIGQDLLIAQELEDHPLKKNITFSDVALLCQQAANSRFALAQALGINLQFILPRGDIKEELSLKLAKDPTVVNKNLALSDFAIPTDPKWLELMIEKLLDISLFLAAGIPGAKLEISLSLLDVNSLIVTIVTQSPEMLEEETEQIFEQYYGKLAAKTNLHLGSGLEGFIAKQIADELNISIKQQAKDGHHLFEINLSKIPVSQAN